jgi:hypothetical protein
VQIKPPKVLLNRIFYFILSLLGVSLIVVALKSKVAGVLKGLLVLTEFSSTVYFLFFVIACVIDLSTGFGITVVMEEVEGMLYFDSLLFLVGVAGSMVSFKIDRSNFLVVRNIFLKIF